MLTLLHIKKWFMLRAKLSKCVIMQNKLMSTLGQMRPTANSKVVVTVRSVRWGK